MRTKKKVEELERRVKALEDFVRDSFIKFNESINELAEMIRDDVEERSHTKRR